MGMIPIYYIMGMRFYYVSPRCFGYRAGKLQFGMDTCEERYEAALTLMPDAVHLHTVYLQSDTHRLPFTRCLPLQATRLIRYDNPV